MNIALDENGRPLGTGPTTVDNTYRTDYELPGPVPTDAEYQELLGVRRKLMAAQGAGSMLSGDGDAGGDIALPYLIEQYNAYARPDDRVPMPWAAIYVYQKLTNLRRSPNDLIPMRVEQPDGSHQYVVPRLP